VLLFQAKNSQKGLISKDSFFMIRNVETDLWLGFYEKQESSESEDKLNRQNQPILYNYGNESSKLKFFSEGCEHVPIQGSEFSMCMGELLFNFVISYFVQCCEV
jgi:hypothetical protein